MSVKYIYAPKHPVRELQGDLHIIREIIENALTSTFNQNLKHFSVESDYFEFTLNISANATDLRRLGAQIAQETRIAAQNTQVKFHFQRKTQCMYALVERAGTYYDVDLFDAEIGNCDLEEINSRIRHTQWYRPQAGDWANRMEYLNLYSLHLTQEEFEACFGADYTIYQNSRKHLYQVEVKHRRLEDETDGQLPPHYFLMEHLCNGDPHYGEYRDVVNIVRCEENDTEKTIQNRIEIYLNTGKPPFAVNPPDEMGAVFCGETQSHTYKFTAHNVGQALATSLSAPDLPTLFFDYGYPDSRNAHTYTGPVAPITDPEQTVIILSHVDLDHWFGVQKERNAYQCTWIIPEQPVKNLFLSVLGKILFEGGTVLYNGGISRGDLTVSHSTTSASSPKRKRKNLTLHETGYAMYLDCMEECTDDDNDTLEPLKILVSGDQEYDYQDQSMLKDINLLVACHHGGKYYWTRSKNIQKRIAQIPKPANDSLIVYSYGNRNTYGHPSKVDDYQKVGWNTSHETVNGDYSREVIVTL